MMTEGPPLLVEFAVTVPVVFMFMVPTPSRVERGAADPELANGQAAEPVANPEIPPPATAVLARL